jgi:tRNA (guanine10-N2)-methyltransferase
MSESRQELLFVFAQAHAEFRIPEIESVAGIYGFSVDLPTDYDVSRPFMVLSMTEEQARLLARRCILIKSATMKFHYEL